ncbi:hypothetical protein LLE49_09705 [Alicyclobacillus tolerans]|uniref:hypothetical protein n=1 Tax=Alicyclobacillus tolerans TaxID=90970 RepID=UPI001F425C00|nr:hypothetical protein [Alicyclobacillus tolerans]MCF8564991.1 hypothetical protein [Alicyclobacillus tolerans]
MEGQFNEAVYLLFEPESSNVKPTAYRITTTEGLAEVCELIKSRTGHIHFISAEEFAHCERAERVTDSVFDPIGANFDFDGVFYIWKGGEIMPKYLLMTPSATPLKKTVFRVTTAPGLLEVTELVRQRPNEARFVGYREFLRQVTRGRFPAGFMGHLCTVVSDCEADGLAEQWRDGSEFRHVSDVMEWIMRPENFIRKYRRKR